jgi:hypothetical protein
VFYKYFCSVQICWFTVWRLHFYGTWFRRRSGVLLYYVTGCWKKFSLFCPVSWPTFRLLWNCMRNTKFRDVHYVTVSIGLRWWAHTLVSVYCYENRGMKSLILHGIRKLLVVESSPISWKCWLWNGLYGSIALYSGAVWFESIGYNGWYFLLLFSFHLDKQG